MLSFLLNIFSGKKRKSRLQLLAEKIGFTLSSDWDYSLDHALQDFTYSGMNRTRPASYNVLSASLDGVRWKIFDHNGSRPSGFWRIFRFQTMIYVEWTGAVAANLSNLGHYFITPHTRFAGFHMLFKKKPAGEAYQVQDTPSGPFLIMAENKTALTGVPQGLLEALGRNKKKRYSIEVLRNSAVFYRKDKVIPLKDIPDLFDDALHFVDLFKGKTAV